MLGKLYKLLPLGKPLKKKKNHKLTEWRGSNLRACFWKIGQTNIMVFYNYSSPVL